MSAPVRERLKAALAVALAEGRALVWLVGLGAMAVLTKAIPAPYRLNESMAYVPVLMGLPLLSWRLRLDAKAPLFMVATILCGAGLVFRSIDLTACPSLPTGTFFLWRLCEGLTLLCVAWAIGERRRCTPVQEQPA